MIAGYRRIAGRLLRRLGGEGDDGSDLPAAVVPSFLILAMTANATGGDWRWIIVALIVFG